WRHARISGLRRTPSMIPLLSLRVARALCIAGTALLLASGALGGSSPSARRDPAAPRLVRVDLSSFPAQRLFETGLDVIEVQPGSFALVLEWPGDAARIARLGVGTLVVDDDPGVTEARRAQEDLASRPRPRGKTVLSAARPDGITRVETLPPFGSGSLAGY